MSKLNILFGFFLIAVTLVFVVQVVNFLHLGFSSIDANKKEFSCSKSDFDINIFEGEKNIALEVSSFKVNITKLTILNDGETYVTYFDPMIINGNSRNILMNITSREDYYFFINDCNNSGIKK